MNISRSDASQNHGYSLVELMIVVSIIALLAQIAVPKFQRLQAKARQAEGKTNLTHMYTLEMSYHAEHGTFVDVPFFGRDTADPEACTSQPNPLGFSVSGPCSKIRYSYGVSFANDTFFHGIAIGARDLIVPGCPKRDFWYIDPQREVRSWEDGSWGDPLVFCL